MGWLISHSLTVLTAMWAASGLGNPNTPVEIAQKAIVVLFSGISFAKFEAGAITGS